MFADGTRNKVTRIMTNVQGLAAIARECIDPARCSRTGLPHAKWAPDVEGGAIKNFKTEEEAEYPHELCEVIAKIFEESDGLPRSGRVLFLEVFSGPRAPLTCAVDAEIRRVAGRETANTAPPRAPAADPAAPRSSQQSAASSSSEGGRAPAPADPKPDSMRAFAQDAAIRRAAVVVELFAGSAGLSAALADQGFAPMPFDHVHNAHAP